MKWEVGNRRAESGDRRGGRGEGGERMKDEVGRMKGEWRRRGAKRPEAAMFNVGFWMLNERNRGPKAVDWSL